MRIGIATSFACGVGIWKRLADEGNDVAVWRGHIQDDSPKIDTPNRLVGQRLVNHMDSWYELLAWCKGDPTALLIFDSSGLGPLADMARKAGVRVVGGGVFCDKLEHDRSFGRDIAETTGIISPPFREFSSIDSCLEYAYSGGITKPVYWKTDTYISGDATHKCEDAEALIDYLTWIKTQTRNNITCVLEEALPGFALSTERWWNGRAWVGPYMWVMERKAHMADDIGPSTGCALNAVGCYEDDEPIISKALNWEALTGVFVKHNAPPGLYDMNAIVEDGKAYFLEWCARFGWDSEPTAQALYPNFSAWLNYVATGAGEPPELTRDVFTAAVRITVAPAPWEYGKRDEKGSAVGMYIRGPVGDLWSGGFIAYQLMFDPIQKLAVAAPEGLVGIAAGVGDAISIIGDDVYEVASEIRAASRPQYRPDLVKAIQEDAQKVIDAGFDDIPGGLLE